ncbi:PAS domain-containing protein [Sulfitobacter sp. LCG007]
MFQTESTSELGSVLDSVPVPLFVAERRESDGEFIFAYVNHALASACVLRPRQMVGKHPRDVFGDVKGGEIAGKWATCARDGQETFYRVIGSNRDSDQEWNTTLKYVPTPDGRDRVVGAMSPVTGRSEAERHLPRFADISYLAAVADYQIGNLATVFERYDSQCAVCLPQGMNADRAAALCRSVRRALSDIRRSAESASARATPQMDSALMAMEAAGGSLLRALGGGDDRRD